LRPHLISIALVLAACGGSDDNGDGNNGNPDAKTFEDAPPSTPMDAPPSTQMGIGQPCTPGMTPQGNCPDGFECLQLNGGSGAWCSKTCTPGAGDTCAMGYVGPGLAQCVYSITGADMQTRAFCGIVCQANNPAQCSATQCDGTCPTPLACTAELMNNQMMVVAKACF